MPQRLSRPERTAANHAAVLAAARTVFLRDGYHGASVEKVAAEAGFTIGAVYSRFRGKADLFLALLSERIDERTAQLRSLAAQRPLASAGGDPARAGESATAVARQWAGILRSDLAWTLLVVEFRVHAARHPVLAARFAEQHQRLLDVVAEVVTTMLGGPAAVPPGRAQDIARAGLAMGPGVALARAAEGSAFTDELIEEMHAAVAARLIAM